MICNHITKGRNTILAGRKQKEGKKVIWTEINRMEGRKYNINL